MIRSLLFFFFLLPFMGNSQVLGHKIDPDKFDADLFNQLVLLEVNKYRKRKRVDTLLNDPILAEAAQDQAEYMAATQQIGHGQKTKEKGSPYKRVLYYGGAHNHIGENVQAFDLEKAITKSKGRLTYDRLARDFVKVWIKSKEHEKNLSEPDYANIGHGFYIKDGVLFAAQVFGSKPFEERYEFVKGSPILMKEGTECYNCKQVKKKIYNDEVSLGWYTVSNDSIYYWNVNHYRKGRIYRKKKGNYLISSKKNNLNKIFQAGGRLSIDLLHYEQFDCGGKTSFHNSPYHNGYYLGSLDKNTILANDIHPSPDLVQVFVGMKPAFKDTFFQVDFHLIKKKRSCISTSTIYVTPVFFLPHEFYGLPKTQRNEDQQLIIEDSVITRIPFERNQTNQDTSIFRPLITILDSLVRDDHQIETIYFTGVASVEGSEKENRKLIMRRGAIVKNYLERYYPAVPFTSDFYENFDDFRSGLIAAGYMDATEISNDTLRLFANDFKDDKEISAILDQTRFSTVKIVYRDYYPIEEGSYGLSIERIQDLIDEEKVSEIIPLFLIMANNAVDSLSENGERLLALDFPKNKRYAKLHWYQFLLDLKLNNSKVTEERLNELQEIGAITSDADYLEFAIMFNLFNQDEGIKIDKAEEILASIRDQRKKAWLETLLLVHEVENFRIAPDAAIGQIMENVIKRKFDLKQTYFVCQYLIQWGYTAEPYVLLSKFARRPGELAKLYMQYLKLGYFLQQFEVEREWKKIRMVLRNLAENHPEDFCHLFQWDQMGVGSLKKDLIAELFCEYCQSNESDPEN